jgi:hypothetical protein
MRDSAEDTATSYRPDGAGFEPRGRRDFYFSSPKSVQTGPGDHPSSINGSRGSSRGYSDGGVALNIHPYLALMVRNAIPLLPP